MNSANINLANGLGDKLLDTIGFYIICKYLNYSPNITFINNRRYAWGTPLYDMRLFHFNDIIIDGKDCPFYINSPNPSSSLCPYKVYEFLKKFIAEITFEQISNDFVLYSKKIIHPSEIIVSNIPIGIEKAYGIHLRKTDKVIAEDFEILTNKLLEDVKNIIMNETDPTFLIVSEDNGWKLKITNKIQEIANQQGKQIELIRIDYKNGDNYVNYNSVLDMFCLSKCKEILQGVHYSTFSMLASLLGTNKIRNYSNYMNSHHKYIIHSWSSVLEINNSKNFDIELYKKIKIKNIETNINKIYASV